MLKQLRKVKRKKKKKSAQADAQGDEAGGAAGAGKDKAGGDGKTAAADKGPAREYPHLEFLTESSSESSIWETDSEPELLIKAKQV